MKTRFFQTVNLLLIPMVFIACNGLTGSSNGNDALLWEGNHSFFIRSVDFSPNGEFIASGDEDNILKVWDTESGENLWSGSHSRSIFVVRFSPGSERLASGDVYGGLKVWNTNSGELLWESNYGDWVYCMRFILNGTYLLVSGVDNHIKIWQVETGEQVTTLTHPGKVHDMAVNSDKSRLASVSIGPEPKETYRTIKLWDLTSIVTGDSGSTGSGHLIWSRSAQADGYYAVDFSPDDQAIISSAGTRVVLWDIESGTIRWENEYHPYGMVHEVVYSPDGTQVAAGGAGSILKVFNADNGESLWAASFEGDVGGIHYSPDGQYITAGSKQIRLFDAATGDRIWSGTHSDIIESIDINAEATKLVSGGRDGKLKVWDISSYTAG